MPLRTRIFIVISLVVLIILGISVVLLLRSRSNNAGPGNNPPTGQNNLPNGTSNGNQTTPTIPVTPIPVAPIPKQTTTLEAEQIGVTQLARIFTERYNSYSTDNNWQNIKEIQSMVTPALWKRLSSKIGVASTDKTFVGVTTQVVNASLSNWAPPQAEVSLKTAKTSEQFGISKTQYQSLTVALLKTGDTWLIDSFTWGK